MYLFIYLYVYIRSYLLVICVTVLRVAQVTQCLMVRLLLTNTSRKKLKDAVMAYLKHCHETNLKYRGKYRIVYVKTVGILIVAPPCHYVTLAPVLTLLQAL